VGRDAAERRGELVVMERRECAADDGPAGGEVDGQLVGDGGVFDVRHAFIGEEGGQDVPVLSGFSGGACLSPSVMRRRPRYRSEEFTM
jgi:hypothetical protein